MSFKRSQLARQNDCMKAPLRKTRSVDANVNRASPAVDAVKRVRWVRVVLGVPGPQASGSPA